MFLNNYYSATMVMILTVDLYYLWKYDRLHTANVVIVKTLQKTLMRPGLAMILHGF